MQVHVGEQQSGRLTPDADRDRGEIRKKSL
jgi:hypothetical protein